MTSSFLIFTRLLAVLFFFVGLCLSPTLIVDRILPAAYVSHRESLIWGLWALKACLVGDAITLALLPWVRRVFPPLAMVRLWPHLSRGEWLIVGLITVLALALRSIGICDGFSYDEIFMFQSLMTKNVAAVFSRAEPWRILYGLLGNISCHLLGASEFAARVPALLLGVAAVPLTYFVARSWCGKATGALAALLLTLSSLHVWYSQDATPYSLVFIFVLAALWLFRRALDGANLLYWILWGVCVFFAIFSHWYIGGVCVATQFMVLGLRCLNGRKCWMDLLRAGVTMIYVMAAVLTLSALTLPRQVTTFATWTGVEKRGPLLDNLQFVGGSLLNTHAPVIWQLCAGIVCLIGLVWMLRRQRELAVYLLLPILLIALHWASSENKVICARYGLSLLIPVVIFSAAGVVCSMQSVRQSTQPAARVWTSMVGAIMLLPLIWGSFTSLQTYYARERYTIRPLASYIAAAIPEYEEVLFGGFAYDKFSFYAPRLRHVPSYEVLQQELNSGRAFWLCYWFPNYFHGMPPGMQEEVRQRGVLEFQYTGYLQSLTEHDYESFCWRIEGKAEGGRRTVGGGR